MSEAIETQINPDIISGTKTDHYNDSLISPEIQEVITQLDLCRYQSDIEKSNILAVLFDIKPVTVQCKIVNPQDRPYYESLLEEKKELNSRLGLYTIAISKPTKTYDDEKVDFWMVYTSKNKKKIDKIKRLFENLHQNDRNNPKKTKSIKRIDYHIGKLLGFPKTAINAFIGKEPRLTFEEQNEILKNNFAAYFCEFAMSRNHFQEEINGYGQKIQHLTQQFLPKTFQESFKEWSQLSQ